MQKVITFFLLSLLYISVFSQNKYAEFLKINNQLPIKNHYDFDSINLKNNYQIRFSKNDSLMFVNLIGLDTVYAILSEDIENGKKSLGGLCADFDSCFFWGWELSSMGNIFGNIFLKEKLLNRSDYFIYLDKSESENYLLLAETYSGKSKQLFFVNVKTRVIYSFLQPKELFQNDLRYLRFLNISNSSFKVKNIKTDKIYFFKKLLANTRKKISQPGASNQYGCPTGADCYN